MIFESLISLYIFTVVSDVGGLLGLFIGCSLLSIVEIIYFLLAALFRFAFKKCSNPKISTVQKNPNQEVIDLFLELRKNDNSRLDQRVSEIIKRIDKLEADKLVLSDLECTENS